jgi:hypothetical protein
MKMVGVAKDDLGSKRSKLFRSDGLDGGLSAHRHEYRCLDITAPRVQDAGTGLTGGIGLEKSEGR